MESATPRMHQAEPSGDPLAQWNASVNSLDAIIRKLVQENADLKMEIADYKFQKFTLTTALSTVRETLEGKESLAVSLEAQLENLRQAAARNEAERNLVMILIDGDGYIFNPELLVRGEDGGREAAKLLSNGVMKYLANEPNHPAFPDLWTIIFLSKDKLEAVLSRTGICTADQFRQFVKGFSQAQPLFSWCEAGPTKEAADHKIKEHLSKFIGNPKVFKAIVGVDHDNGYSPALSSAMTNDYDQRLVLLQAHPEIARDIAVLNLPTFSVDTLFKEEKITSAPPRMPTPVSTPKAIGVGSYAAIAGPPKSPPPSVATTVKKITYSPEKNTVGWTKGATKRNPPPCNAHYLIGYCALPDCKYSHEYKLTEAELEQLSLGAKQQPCHYVNDHADCWVENCIYGHRCPRGPNCPYLARKTCKFVGKRMHD